MALSVPGGAPHIKPLTAQSTHKPLLPSHRELTKLLPDTAVAPQCQGQGDGGHLHTPRVGQRQLPQDKNEDAGSEAQGGRCWQLPHSGLTMPPPTPKPRSEQRWPTHRQLQLPHGPGQGSRPAGPECEPDPTRPRGWGEWQSGVSWEPRGGPWKGTAGAQGDIESLAQAPVADPQRPAWGTTNCSVRSGPTSPLASRVGESEGARGPRAWVGSRGAWTVQVGEEGHGGGVPRPGRWWPSTPGVRVTEAARGSCASEWHCCRAGRAWLTCAGGTGPASFYPCGHPRGSFFSWWPTAARGQRMGSTGS